MNEFELIAKLTHSLPTNHAVSVGAGDDCAVLDLGVAEKLFLFKTDAVVEGVHFTKATPPEKIGRKALARCLSDIAAMAGTPESALVTLGLPRGFDVAFVEKIYAGMAGIAREHGIAIVGGETTTTPVLLLNIALLGHAPRGRCVLRSGAETGDAIFVTGELGGSLAGRHLDFEPRLAEARWLGEHFLPHAMIDLSDGLAGDLKHILAASKVGAELLTSSLPISRAAKELARSRVRGNADATAESQPHSHECGYESNRKPALLAALTDGEDFELLFTVAAKDAVALLDAWKGKFPETKLTCIGKITAGSGLALRDARGVRPFTGHGYVHFTDS
jgi:thiamine-monophosphate kinase